jgi:RNA polymerase sigma factor (sigma-70 family)
MLPVESLFQEADLPANERRRMQTFLERMADESGDVLSQWIDGLPERQRVALALRYYEALRPDEISIVLGVSEATVHELLQKAAESVRATMHRSEQKTAPKNRSRR